MRTNRLAANPAGIGARNLDGDRRRVRRDISSDELRIIDAATCSPSVTVEKKIRNASASIYGEGADEVPRAGVGVRLQRARDSGRAKSRSLTPESFDLDGDTPSVAGGGRIQQKRKRADASRSGPTSPTCWAPWLKTKPGGVVCPLPDGKAGMLLKADMETARAAWLNEAGSPAERASLQKGRLPAAHGCGAPRGGLPRLRVHYVSRVVMLGANVKEAMERARHSDPKLTLKTYALVGMHNPASARRNAQSRWAAIA